MHNGAASHFLCGVKSTMAAIWQKGGEEKKKRKKKREGKVELTFSDRRFDNRRELVRGSDTAGSVQLPIGNWGRISAELKFALRCPNPPPPPSTVTPNSSLIKPIKPVTPLPLPFFAMRRRGKYGLAAYASRSSSIPL